VSICFPLVATARNAIAGRRGVTASVQWGRLVAVLLGGCVGLPGPSAPAVARRKPAATVRCGPFLFAMPAGWRVIRRLPFRAERVLGTGGRPLPGGETMVLGDSRDQLTAACYAYDTRFEAQQREMLSAERRIRALPGTTRGVARGMPCLYFRTGGSDGGASRETRGLLILAPHAELEMTAAAAGPAPALQRWERRTADALRVVSESVRLAPRGLLGRLTGPPTHGRGATAPMAADHPERRTR
jgi:hypothetical protein